MILMIPTIARTSEEVLLLIPNDLREAGVALGGTQWRTVALVVVPAAKSGLVTALILGIARVAGETAPLVLLTGGGESVNLNPFDCGILQPENDVFLAHHPVLADTIHKCFVFIGQQNFARLCIGQVLLSRPKAIEKNNAHAIVSATCAWKSVQSNPVSMNISVDMGPRLLRHESHGQLAMLPPPCFECVTEPLWMAQGKINSLRSNLPRHAVDQSAASDAAKRPALRPDTNAHPK
jgi:hypothetical protein